MSLRSRSPRTRRRITWQWFGIVGMAAIATASLAACGDEQQSDAGGTSTPAASAPATSVPVVAGPSPHSATHTTRTSAVSSAAATATTCGNVPGPDGALRVLVLAGNVDCATAQKVATEYSPKIATGHEQQVSGWTCGPSEARGILAACQSGNKAIGLTP
ncbi:hypothetical protein ACLQ3C_16070 [Gordonia sp. DT30]|uniref:hypothetical protein n=1 Tax=unclassified Gordonia (in: high G+C Gram-positive bacteria) TaxID=2657482 RepID=UPI003CE8B5A6